MPNFENAFKTVCELVEDFKENEHIYLSAKYNESQARKDFIDKFFIALGWDVNHTLQKNPHKQEVKVEQTLENQSRPDYTFYLEPNFKEPKFFVEAKKPSRDLLNADFYFQAINYARSASTPVTVLTDFQEFHILDSRYKPNINTVLKNQNHLVYKYTDYADREKFAVIYYLFSRDDVANNSIKDYADKLTVSDKKRKKTGYAKGELLSIDEEFLLYLDNIRVRLAKAFKKADASLSSEELTEATQRTIDRLVFIRFLEDKNIEPEDFISKLGTSGKAWNDFIAICRKLDAKYNGIVFKEHFIDNQNFGGPELSEFKNVCFEFSRKNSQSFNYNLIPIHILGSIYERFLGKVVNATAQRVKVEEKPEVRKAGGVYYTPKYIVDYIVDNTVGKIIRNENESTPTVSSPRVLGGDLIKTNKENTISQDTRQEHAGMTNIVGKTPAQISKLRFADIACGSGSFLIGVFETLLDYHNNYYWLNQEEAKKDGCIFKDGVPFLSIKQKQNILLNNIYGVDIDPQAVEVTQLSLALKMLEDESLATANEMQVLFHEKILPDLSKNIICGNSLIGIDIIEGNLFPTVEQRKLNILDFKTTFKNVFDNGGFDAIIGNPPYGAEIPLNAKKYLKKTFNSENLNTAALFVIKSKQLINDTGYIGLIIPKSFNYSSKWLSLRNLIHKDISVILDASKAFKEVLLEQVIIVTKSKTDGNFLIGNISFDKLVLSDVNKEMYTQFDVIPFANLKELEIANKVAFNCGKFSEKIKSYRGIDIPQIELSNSYDIPIFSCKNVQRYSLRNTNRGISKDYYKMNESLLSYMTKHKIVIQNIVAHVQNPFPHIILMATWDDIPMVSLGSVSNLFVKDTTNINPKFVIALLNSKFINWYAYRFIYCDAIRTMRLDNYHFDRMPFPNLDLNNKSEKERHDNLAYLVEQMIDVKKHLEKEKTEKNISFYNRRCADLDNAIDTEVYKLYGLTSEEIKIVEGR